MMLWIAAALAIGWFGLRVFYGYPATKGRYAILCPPQAAFLAAAAEATFPPGGAIRASGLEADLPAYVDRWIALLGTRPRLLMMLLFFLVEHATILFPGPGPRGMRRFSSLSLEQRIAVLDGWGGSRIYLRRLVFMSLRATLTMGFVAYPPVLQQLGVVPFAIDSPICEADLLYPSIGKLPEDNPYGRDDLTPPSDGTPLVQDSSLHAEFAKERT